VRSDWMAAERKRGISVWPGDIIGFRNLESLRISVTLTEGNPLRITGSLSFAPEILGRGRDRGPNEVEASPSWWSDVCRACGSNSSGSGRTIPHCAQTQTGGRMSRIVREDLDWEKGRHVVVI